MRLVLFVYSVQQKMRSEFCTSILWSSVICGMYRVYRCLPVCLYHSGCCLRPSVTKYVNQSKVWSMLKERLGNRYSVTDCYNASVGTVLFNGVTVIVLWYSVIIIIIRQFVRRHNMSVKSLQGRHTEYATRIKLHNVWLQKQVSLETVFKSW